MKPVAIVGALLGGLLGAVAWGGIVSATNVEIGYMAVGVGFLVGYGSALLGGRGTVNGVLCAIIALLSMFGGKMMAVKFGLPGEMRKELKADPKYADLTPAQVDQVIDEAQAKVVTVPLLAQTAAQNLDVIDILFAVFGVAAAFQLGARGHYRGRPVAYTTQAPGGPQATPAPLATPPPPIGTTEPPTAPATPLMPPPPVHDPGSTQ